MKFCEDADITTFDAIATPIRTYKPFAGGQALIPRNTASPPSRIRSSAMSKRASQGDGPKVDAFGRAEEVAAHAAALGSGTRRSSSRGPVPVVRR